MWLAVSRELFTLSIYSVWFSAFVFYFTVLKKSLESLFEGAALLPISDCGPLSRRPQPHGAAVRLPGEDQPDAQRHVQLGEGRGEDVAPPGRELRAQAGRDRGHDGRPAAL